MTLPDLAELHEPHKWQAEVARLREENAALKVKMAELTCYLKDAYFEGAYDCWEYTTGMAEDDVIQKMWKSSKSRKRGG